jgi:fimbrial chaperone protein
VAILEVQNTGETPTLAQVDALDWSQGARGESLEPSSELIATPLVMNLAAGETQKVRVGLREPARFEVERSYRLVVEEVAPAVVAAAGLRFAVRISVPVFAVGTDRRVTGGGDSEGLSWARRPASPGCEHVLVSNTSDRHVHLLRAELLSAQGEALWESGSPDYVLAGSQQRLRPEICSPVSIPGSTIRLTTESRTIILPASDAGMLVDVK